MNIASPFSSNAVMYVTTVNKVTFLTFIFQSTLLLAPQDKQLIVHKIHGFTKKDKLSHTFSVDIELTGCYRESDVTRDDFQQLLGKC